MAGQSVTLDRSSIVDRVSEGVVRRCEIDLRALAALRIGVGLVILVDLLGRARHLTAFYTDAGVLPTKALFNDYSDVYSLHTLSGDAWFQALLFVIAGVAAVALVVGYRTRYATAISWLLLLSLRARNPMVFNSGDHLLGLLLFWGVFLPLGERWSLDAKRIDRDRTTVASIATIAILLQVLVVYATNAVHKFRSDAWTNGEAVPLVMQADHYTILLGNHLDAFPTLLEFMSFFWLWMLYLSPLLLLLTGPRRAVFATVFVGMHLGMILTMAISIFPLVSMVSLLVYYPPSVWDWLTDVGQRVGIFDRANDTRIQINQSLSEGPIWGFDGRLPGIEAGNDGSLREQKERAWEVTSTVVPYIFLVLMITSSFAGVGYGSVPEPADRALEITETNQRWSMFAPNPIQTTRWYAAPAHLEDGSRVDALHGGSVDLDRPPDAAATYDSARWRKYIVNVHFAGNEKHRSYLANFLCDRWTRNHDREMTNVSIMTMYERTDPYNGSVVAAGKYELIEYDCDGPFVQEA
jgi:hypothetical protein